MKILDFIDIATAKIIKQYIPEDDISLKDIKQTLEEAGNNAITYFEIKLTLAMKEKGDL